MADEQTIEDQMVSRQASGASSIQEMVLKIRNKEQWIRYDSIVIGQGARAEDSGWFNNWDDLAGAENLQLFGAGRSNVNRAWCNTSDREDWAQLVYGMYCEFIAPTSDLARLTNAFDFDFASWFTTEVPRSTYLTVNIASQDNILQIPASYAPSGHGTTELRIDGASSPSINPGQVGIAGVRELWTWPVPLGIPAVKKINVTLKIDKRVFNPLVGLTNAPGSTVFATVDPLNPLNTILRSIPNRFVIRVGLIGPRFAQLRGAYSQGTT
jgi:hypothetical protein